MKVYIVEYWHSSTGCTSWSRLGIYKDHQVAVARVEEQLEWVIDYHGAPYPTKWSLGLGDEWRSDRGEQVRIVTEELVGS